MDSEHSTQKEYDNLYGVETNTTRRVFADGRRDVGDDVAFFSPFSRFLCRFSSVAPVGLSLSSWFSRRVGTFSRFITIVVVVVVVVFVIVIVAHTIGAVPIQQHKPATKPPTTKKGGREEQ